MIQFSCTHCGLKFRVKPEFAGRTGQCPTCKQPLAVPVETPQPKPPLGGELEGVESSLHRAGLEVTVSLAPPADAPAPGKSSIANLAPGQARTGSRYVVDKEIARGGMGAVVKAIDSDIRREVAIKFMLDDCNRDSQKRFVEEAQITGQLEHPNIVPIHELGLDAEKRLFFAMKLVNGRSLGQIVAALRKEPATAEKDWPLSRLLTIFANVCHALEYAHSRGVIHRDLKPANIMVGDFGEVYVMDWGLAKVMGPRQLAGQPFARAAIVAQPAVPSGKNSGKSSAKVVTSREMEGELTQDGAILGTPVYMPPEQARGEVLQLDQRSDIYSLGAILYELLTLLAPVEKKGGHIGILLRVVEGEIVSPEKRVPERAQQGKVPKELAAVAMKAMALLPEKRYQQVAELRKDIERFQEGRSVSAKDDSAWDAVVKLVKRNKGVSAATAASLLVLTVVLAVAFQINYSARLDAEKARRVAEGAERTATGEQRRAEKSAELARLEKKRADEQTATAVQTAHRLEREVYKQRLARAYQEWEQGNVAPAVRLLEECQPALRGWEWHYVWNLCHQGLLTFRGHRASVESMTFSPDGKWIASAAADGQIRVWNAATAEGVFAFDFPLERRYRLRGEFLAFSADGKRLAAGCEDSVVRIWDTNNWREVFKLEEKPDSVGSLAFSPDGKFLAVGYTNAGQKLPAVAKIWDLATRTTLHTLEGHARAVAALEFSRDGKQLVTAGREGTLRLWDVATGEQLQLFTGHVEGAFCAAFGSDQQQLVSAGMDGTIRLWDKTTGKVVSTVQGDAGAVNSLQLAPGGKRFASGGNDSSVKIWDAATLREVLTLRGHTAPITAVCFDNLGSRLASASDDGTVKVWDTNKDQQAARINFNLSNAAPEWVRAVGFTTDSRTLVAGGSSSRAFDSASGKPTGKDFKLAHPYSVDFSSDGKLMALCGKGTIRIWNLAEGRELVTTQEPPVNRYVFSVAFSPDGRRVVASLPATQQIKILDAQTGEVLRTKDKQGFVLWATFHPDGERIASVNDDAQVRIWNAATGEDLVVKQGPAPVGHYKSTNSVVNLITFSPDGRHLVLAGGTRSEFGQIHFWDATTGETRFVLQSHTDVVSAVAFNRTGTRLVSTSLDGDIKLWDPETREELFSLSQGQGLISVAFSPDGHRIAVGSTSDMASIFDGAPAE